MDVTPATARTHDENLDRLFHALSDATRRDILQRCLTQEPSVSGLATAYPISLTAVQKHVHVLEDAGLVERRRSGREQLVRTRHEGLEQARQALDKLERTWRGRTERMAALLSDIPANATPGVAMEGTNDDRHQR